MKKKYVNKFLIRNGAQLKRDYASYQIWSVDGGEFVVPNRDLTQIELIEIRKYLGHSSLEIDYDL